MTVFYALPYAGLDDLLVLGFVLVVALIFRYMANKFDYMILLHDLCDTMEQGSLCAMGGMTPFPVRSALTHFGQDFTGIGKGDN